MGSLDDLRRQVFISAYSASLHAEQRRPRGNRVRNFRCEFHKFMVCVVNLSWRLFWRACWSMSWVQVTIRVNEVGDNNVLRL